MIAIDASGPAGIERERVKDRGRISGGTKEQPGLRTRRRSRRQLGVVLVHPTRWPVSDNQCQDTGEQQGGAKPPAPSQPILVGGLAGIHQVTARAGTSSATTCPIVGMGSARAAQDQEVLVRQDRARGDQPQPGAAGIAQEAGAGHALPGRRPKL